MNRAAGGEYHHDLDAARGVLMVLGILLHAASIYMIHATWAVDDPRTHVAFNHINSVIHLFRMPAFFLVAGFFCAWSLARYPVGDVARRRFARLAVPLLATGLTVNAVQWWLIWQVNAAGFSRRAQSETLPGWFMAGDWIGHLWFLVLLLAFVLGTAALARVPGAGRLRKLAASTDRVPAWVIGSGLVVLVLPLLSFLAPAAAKVVPEIQLRFGTVSIHRGLIYLPFFLVGLWIWAAPRWRDALLTFRPWYAVLGGGAYVFLVTRTHAPVSLTDTVAQHYVHAVAVWSTSLLVLGVFHRWCRRPSRFWAWLAEASYTIYLFHHLLVVAGGFALVYVDWPIGLKFVVLVAGVFVSTAALHQLLVARSRWLSLLFNGRFEARSARPG